MSNSKSDPPSTIDSDDDDSDGPTHPEHDDILDQAIVIWRMIAELAGVSPNGENGAQAIELLMSTFYEQRREALNFSYRLLEELCDTDTNDAEACRNGKDFSAEKIAMLRERAAAFDMASFMLFQHMREMVEGHVHFNKDQAHRIGELADEIVGKDDPKDKSN